MILKYSNIDIFQGEHPVLQNVSFTIDEGEMVYLIGAVGSGKSSLLKSIYGEVSCSGDEADVLGFDMLKLKTKHHPKLRRQMGIVFQDFQLLQDRTVAANLDFILRATDWNKKEERDNRIDEVINMVKLDGKQNKYIFELSGGEQQRICIARALLNNPKLIIADEPTGNLDAENGEMILALLDEVRRQQHTSIIMSTHNPNWPDYFPGSVYECDGGRLKRINDNK